MLPPRAFRAGGFAKVVSQIDAASSIFQAMANDTELVSANIAEMARALSGADPSLIEEFLYSLFTSSEADEIAKRWALVKQIADGRPQTFALIA